MKLSPPSRPLQPEPGPNRNNNHAWTSDIIYRQRDRFQPWHELWHDNPRDAHIALVQIVFCIVLLVRNLGPLTTALATAQGAARFPGQNPRDAGGAHLVCLSGRENGKKVKNAARGLWCEIIVSTPSSRKLKLFMDTQ